MINRNCNILLVGSSRDFSLENMYLRAFMANGINKVDLLDIDLTRPDFLKNRFINRALPIAGRSWASRRLLDHLREFSNKYQLIIIFKGMAFTPNVIQEAKKISSKAIWVNINGDDPYNTTSRGASNYDVLQSIQLFDAYCIWSRRIAERLIGDDCKKVIYLPFGYDEKYHAPVVDNTCALPDLISFIGAWDKDRETVLGGLSSYNFKIYCKMWEQASYNFPLRNNIVNHDVFGNEMSKIISSSAISLNMLRPQNTGAHNMRTFEIPAMGGLMLTNRTKEQQEYFPEDTACYMYSGTQELKDKIDYILANKQEADRVRAQGIEMVKQHSYTKRAQLLLQELGL